MNQPPLRFMGAPVPRTREECWPTCATAVPYEFLADDPEAEQEGLPRPKVAFFQPSISLVLTGALGRPWILRPLIRRFEGEFEAERLFTNPAVAFLGDHGDYADEWLKAMFHYRWYYEADIDQAGTYFPSGEASKQIETLEN